MNKKKLNNSIVIKSLIKKINYHDNLYYNKNYQEISDEDNDNITDENEKIVIEDESVRFLNTNDQDDSPAINQEEKECNNSENDVNDDLLQIPAFLRRQAN